MIKLGCVVYTVFSTHNSCCELIALCSIFLITFDCVLAFGATQVWMGKDYQFFVCFQIAEGLYPSLLREYKKMAQETSRWQIFIREVNNCKNACVRGKDEERRFSSERCRCDEQCVVFGDCCPDYWERWGDFFILFCKQNWMRPRVRLGLSFKF